jgi:predicted Fe-S protein YdhL (DUF1289 family)
MLFLDLILLLVGCRGCAALILEVSEWQGIEDVSTKQLASNTGSADIEETF